MKNHTSSIFIFLLITGALSISKAQTWQFSTVGNGTKPELDLDAQGLAHITYMFEDFNGEVEYAKGNINGFTRTQVLEGYFYAPLDICVDQNGSPRIVYHDHDSANLVQSTLQSNGNFNTVAIGSSGHDGWYPSIAIDANNNSHIISVDPSNGIEYASQNGFNWNIESVRGGSTRYEWGTSLLIDDNDRKHAAFFVQQENNLFYASKDNGAWITELVKDAAFFPSLDLDENNDPVMSFLEVPNNDNVGNFRLAEKVNGNWVFEDIASLNNVHLGFSGARGLHRLKIVNGVKHLLYSDQYQVMYTKNENGSWQTEQVVNNAASGVILGQHVDMDIDVSGNVHIVYHETGPSSSKDGTIIYGVRTNTTSTNNLRITCPSDTQVSCELDPHEGLSGSPEIITNPGTSSMSSYTDQINAPSCAMAGDTIIRTWTVSNELGQSQSCLQQIVSEPDEDKIYYPDDRTFDFCYEDFLNLQDDSLATTGCDDRLEVRSNLSVSAITCGSSYQITRTWSVYDNCNNIISSKDQHIQLNNSNPFSITDTNITPDSGNNSGSITIYASCGISPYTYDWTNGLIGNVQNNLSAGRYDVTVTDQVGCQITQTFEVPAIPMINFISGNIFDQVNNPVTNVNIAVRNITTGDVLTNCSDDETRFSFCSQNQFGADDKLELCLSKNTPISDQISAQDIVKATKLILGLETSCPDDLIAADVDHSQTISARDLVIMRKAVLGLQDTFPDNRNWLFLNASNQEFVCDTFASTQLPITNLNIKAIKLGDLKCDANVIVPDNTAVIKK